MNRESEFDPVTERSSPIADYCRYADLIPFSDQDIEDSDIVASRQRWAQHANQQQEKPVMQLNRH